MNDWDFTGYVPRVGSGKYRHHFGGITPATLPGCPNCNLRLTQFAVLDTSDLRLQYDWSGQLLRLVYCLRCNLCWEPFSYRLVDQDHIDILEVNLGSDFDDEEWKAEIGEFLVEQGFDLCVLPVEANAIARKMNEVGDLSDEEGELWNAWARRPSRQSLDAMSQIRGETFRIQRNENPRCTDCGMAMSMLATFYSGRDDAYQFAPRMSSTQIFFFCCEACRVITVEHRI